jgi:hypothetical protein
MIKGKYAFNLIRIFSPKKFDLLTETLYNKKNEEKKQNIKCIYKNPKINSLKNTLNIDNEIILKKKKNNRIKSLDDIKEVFDNSQYFYDKQTLSPNKFIQNIKLNNKNLIKSKFKSELFKEKKIKTEEEEEDEEENEDNYNSNESLPVLKNYHSLSNILFKRDYKKKHIDNKVMQILRSELMNAKNNFDFKIQSKKLKIKKEKLKHLKLPKNDKIMRISINYSEPNNLIKKKSVQNTNNKVREFNFISKIKLLHTPPFFQINSKITQGSILKDIKIMSNFERYNYSKLK